MEQITTERLLIQPVKIEDAVGFHQLIIENRDHLQPWEPQRDESYYLLDTHIQNCETAQEAFLKGTSFSFSIKLKQSNELIGRINLNNIVRGVFQNAYLGYFMARKYNGRGYMTEAVKSIVNIAFEKLNLHRVQAAVIPENMGSIRVLEKSGFRKEGLAYKYLKINGKWQDHYLFAITNDKELV